MSNDDATHQVSEQTDSVLVDKLMQLELSEDDALGYLQLVKNGPSGAMAISKALGLPRTNVYRLIERLDSLDLVEVREGPRGALIVARPPKALEQMVLARQHEVTVQKELLPTLLGELANLTGKGPLGSRILYYEGIEGLQQVTLNSLEAKNGISIYEIYNLTGFMDFEFAESFRRELVRRRIFTRQLTNLATYDEYTEVDSINELWELRYVDPAELKIEFEILLYNDVCALYTHGDDETFCAEIRSPALAAMQQSIFDVIWKRAQVMTAADTPSSRKLKRSSRPTPRL